MQHVFKCMLHSCDENVFGLWLQNLYLCRKPVSQRTTSERRLPRNWPALCGMCIDWKFLHQRKPVILRQKVSGNQILLLHQFRGKKRLVKQRMRQPLDMFNRYELYG